MRACPPKKKNEDGKCVPCDGPCPKVCNFNDKQIHAGNIDRLQNCTVIEGHITILDSSFDGYQASINRIYYNYSQVCPHLFAYSVRGHEQMTS